MSLGAGSQREAHSTFYGAQPRRWGADRVRLMTQCARPGFGLIIREKEIEMAHLNVSKKKCMETPVFTYSARSCYVSIAIIRTLLTSATSLSLQHPPSR